MSTIHLTVNGHPVTAHNEEQSLLAFLREELGLVGAKDGCARGQCGACTVIVNDRAQKSCLLKMGKRSASSHPAGFSETQCISVWLLHPWYDHADQMVPRS